METTKKPLGIQLEVTNNCNLRCPTCANKTMTRKRGFMSMELFKKAIDQSTELGVKQLGMYTRGEPLLHPKIFEMLEYITIGDLKVNLSTNGLALTKEMTKKIVFSGLFKMLFSVDGYTKDVYEKHRVGSDFQKVLDNIKYFKKFRDFNKKIPQPLIIIRGMVTKYTQGKSKEYIDFWGPYADAITQYVVQNEAGQAKEVIDFAVGKQIINPKLRDPCPLLFTNLLVNWDGKVTCCCVDFNEDLIVGDLNKESLLDIWNGEKMKHFRKLHIEKRFDEMPLCGKCYPNRINGYEYCVHSPRSVDAVEVFSEGETKTCPLCGVKFVPSAI